MKNRAENNYDALMNKLDLSSNGDIDENFLIYKKMEALSEGLIDEFKEILTNDIQGKDGTPSCGLPAFLDDYAAPMDNLAKIYIEKKEYIKALDILEKVLPIYRTLEIRNPRHSYQRYYATQHFIKCLKEVGKEEMAILYEYELIYLWNDVLKQGQL